MADAEYGPNDLRDLLADELARRAVTQREAAEALLISQQTLSRWLSGSLKPSVDALPAIARYVHKPLSEIRKMWGATSRAQRRNRLGDADLVERVREVERSSMRIEARLESLIALVEKQAGQAAPRKKPGAGKRRRGAQ